MFSLILQSYRLTEDRDGVNRIIIIIQIKTLQVPRKWQRLIKTQRGFNVMKACLKTALIKRWPGEKMAK